MTWGGKRQGSGRKKGQKTKRLSLVERMGAEASGLAITSELRATVALAVAAGQSEQDIAAALEITIDQLRQKFPKELLQGSARARFESIARLRKQAEAGSVAAARTVEQIIAGGGQGAPSSPVGKKAAADVAARDGELGTGWEDLISEPTIGRRPN